MRRLNSVAVLAVIGGEIDPVNSAAMRGATV